MLELLNIHVNQFDMLLLMFMRMLGLMMIAAIFGRRNIPNMAKAGLAMALTYLLMLAYPPQSVEYTHMLEFAFMCAKEVIFGMILGYATQVFLSTTFVAGQVIDMQSGFSMVNVLDPQSNMQVPITGNLLNIILLLCFFQVQGPNRLIEMLALTLERVPVGTVTVSTEVATAAIQIFITAFVLGMSIAMPSIAAGVTVEVALGVMIRTVPQMNMYVVGIPVKIIIGFLVLWIVIPVFVGFSNTIFDHLYEGLNLMFEGVVSIA